MMENLKSKSKENLLSELKNLICQERKLVLQVLEYLHEVESRRLYLEMGFSSLFEFCVKELGYSEPSAQRRISAMRLIKDLPDVKDKIKEGSLNLTSLNQASLFLSQERRVKHKIYSSEEKRDLLGRLEGKSKRECERELIKISPESAIIRERERMITEDQIEVKFVISKELKLKLDKVRALISHKNPNPSYEELITELTEIALKKLDWGQKALSPAKVKSTSYQLKALPAEEVEEKRLRYIPVNIKREIWQRDQGKCQFVDPTTKRRCHSTHFIQIDHIKPYSQSGSSKEPQNLRLLCGQHNRWRYKQEAGAK